MTLRVTLTIALLFAASFAAAQPVSPAQPPSPRGTLLSGAYMAFAIGQALDVESTSLALSRGARESNTIMRPCVGTPACSSAVKAATTAGVLWIVDTRIRPHSKTAAVITMIGLTAAQSFVVARNYRVARVLGQR